MINEINLGLDRISKVSKILNLTQFDAFVITVAGTNGKGSTVAALETIYKTAGYTVGSYTSPHLRIFNERIKINNINISNQDLENYFEKIEKARKDIPLTYFEIATLAAFLYFKAHKLDIIILEVGLGGRLDATNIINPDLAIITTVALDHEAYLGNTIEAIGFEKAGIFRKNTPCIFGDFNPPLSIESASRKLNSDLYILGKEYNFSLEKNNFCFNFKQTKFILPKSSIHPKALAAAIMAINIMQKKLLVNLESIKKAIPNINILGRQQQIKGKITTILDVAHNPQAVNYLVDFIRNMSLNTTATKIRAVFSALKDKDVLGLIKPMLSYVHSWYPALLDTHRALKKNEISGILKQATGSAHMCYDNPTSAYKAALQNSVQGDYILVYGSFHTVGAILEYLNEINIK